MWRKFGDAIIESLLTNFKNHFVMQKFLDEWKNIVPIFKKGDKRISKAMSTTKLMKFLLLLLIAQLEVRSPFLDILKAFAKV